MAETQSPAADETRTERIGMAITPTEKDALARIAAIFPERYEGVSSVLRDYTPSGAVSFVERLRSTMAAA